MARVLTIGECMAELSPSEAKGDFHLGFAGDTFNTAWYLAQLRSDATVSFLTTIGTDKISCQMRDFIRASGINDSYVRALPDRTIGLYLISLDNGERSFSYWRGQSAARRLADDPIALAEAMNGNDLVYFSGITLAILDSPARQALLEALKASRAAGTTIAFDPNLRPRLWAATDEMTKVVMQGAAASDIVLPSFEDEAEWFHDADPEKTTDRYTAVGATTVIVKNGADPVYYRHNAMSGTVPVSPVPSVVDTTAAGDSFNAVILAGLQNGISLIDCIPRACRLAGHVVQGRGALVQVDSQQVDH